MRLKQLYGSCAYTIVYVSSSVNSFRPGEARTENEADGFVLPEVIVGHLFRQIMYEPLTLSPGLYQRHVEPY